MGLFQAIKNWFSNTQQNAALAKKFGLIYQIDEDIPALIEQWRNLYMGVDCKEGVEPSGLSAMISKDLATKACSELAIAGVSGNAELEDLGIFDDEMLLAIRQQTEYALAMGFVVMRPYVVDGRVLYSWYTADRVLPTAWNGRDLTECMLLDYVTRTEGGSTVIYTKVEAHGYDRADGKYHIKTKLFKNYSYNNATGDYTGQEVPLTAIEEWAEISPDVVIENPIAKTFCYMGTPVANNKALNVPIGVSIFKDAVPFLKEFDEAFTSAKWENWAGRAKLFLADSMIPKKQYNAVNNGKRVVVDDVNALEQKYYRKMETESTENLIEPYNPALRFDSYSNYMNQILHMVCTLAGLDAGQYVFNEHSQAVTAREIVSKQQKTYHTIVDIQRYMIKPMVDQIVATVRQLELLYSLPAIPENIELSIDFGDSILTDEETEKQTAQIEVQTGLRSKLSYLMDYRGLTEEEAMAELERIKADQPSFVAEGF